MSTRFVIDSPLSSAAPARSARELGGIGRLALIVVFHVGLVAAIASGVTPSAPRAAAAAPVMVSFVSAAPAPAPQPVARDEPPAPKPVQKPQPKPRPKLKPQAKAKPEPAPLPDKPVSRPMQQDVAPAAAEPLPAPQPAPMAQAQDRAPAPTTPPLPPVPATPPTISSGIQYLQAPSPEYPPISRRMGEEGQVMMRVYVNERGRPERADVHTSSGSPRLDEAARRAVLRAVFKPHIESGRPVAVFALIPIRFQLDS